MLVPCIPGYEKQSYLIFIDKDILNFKINNNQQYPKNIDLSREFRYDKFREFQFIIYIDFLLILKYDEINKWQGKVFSLCFEDDSFFDRINTINITGENLNKQTKFSFDEIKDKKYLFSVTINNNNPIINCWEIDSKLSGISTNFQVSGQKNNLKDINIPLGNCIINHFYHCFEKYPLLGAIQYHFKNYEKKTIKISFSIDKIHLNKINYLKDYLNELCRILEIKKKISFNDINFIIDDSKINFSIKDSSIGDILIKLIEITPIQIAKIIGNEFKIMSNGDNIEKKLHIETTKRKIFHKDTKFNIREYSKMINFCIKDSIFNFFKIPVIVICCFGTQSIGKSTFLNELAGTLFNVSGMRCTEGIWMSVRLFIHNLLEKKNNCDLNCFICNNNKCHLLKHHNEKKCLCENCICGKQCFLNENNIYEKEKINCNLKCCLVKDHENSIKCSFNNCNCKCICECNCSSDKQNNIHEHLCFQCKKEKKNNCSCKCNCKHICKIPILLHNFICVCLDFEGLGTFERTNEQDIQMALVGSAMGNIIIFRTGNSFDRFTENTLKKIALGSQKIQSIDLQQFFGGSLFFSPKDVIEIDKNKLRDEFKQKIEKSILEWNSSIKLEKKRNYSIFGLFEDYVFAPTPQYLEMSFYSTLRQKFIPNTFKYKKNPIYKIGKEFCYNLKLFLSAVYMNEYEFLTNYKEDMIKAYINENLQNAYEFNAICNDIENNNKNKLLKNENEIRIYINKEFLHELEIMFSFNNKYEYNNNLVIDNIKSLNFKEGTFEIYNLSIDIIKKGEDYFSMSINNFNDFGLILKIPKELKDIINYNKLCSDLFKLWDIICKKVGLSEEIIISNFNLFISAIEKRRNKNISNWINEMTKNYNNLKEFQNQYSPLTNIWILCRQDCKKCYYKCCLLNGHEKEHDCLYDHKCKKKCDICLNCKCSKEDCKQNCIKKSGHPEIHTCNHFHRCPENCDLKDKSIDCGVRCNLEFKHNSKHDCGLRIHHCREFCYLKDKAKNCGEKCILSVPHDGKHICKNTHLCKEQCDFKGNSKGCKEYCSLYYDHEQKHDCGEKHFCIKECSFKGKSNNCGEICILEIPHEGKLHNCGKYHYCKIDCYLKGKAQNCKEICTKQYGHDGNHSCGEIHYCKEKCDLFNKTKNCGGRCILQFPHEGKNHLCDKEHYCKKQCILKNISKNCQENCSLKFGHKGECICNFVKEKHLCNKKCNISEECNKDCILTAGHEKTCLCGTCNCPEPCKYKDCSRNCNLKCQFNAGHQGNQHVCEVFKHYCKFECCYKNKSVNCNNVCFYEVNHQEKIHMCNIAKEQHGCVEKCFLFQISRCCNENCSLKIEHKGNHLCDVLYENHLCKSFCDLLDKSRECNNYCNKPVNHKGEHICSLIKEKHICKNICSLYKNSRAGCNINCNLKAGHYDDCLCQYSKSEHICNNKCIFFNKSNGCKEFCILPVGHEDDHKCLIPKENHLCKGICHLYGKTRGRCSKSCCLSYGHKESCICNRKSKHLCDKECSLFGKSKGECQKLCNLDYGHYGEHLCEIPRNNHLCPNNCYYYSKCKGICNQYCCLPFGHYEICICKEPHNHLCPKKCFLYNKSRGCNIDCSKYYDHYGNCQCSIEPSNHTCKENCELCLYEMQCGHVFNHVNEKLKCNKCKNNYCVLSEKGHLCGGQHNCSELCKSKGWCEIEVNIKQECEIYTSRSGENIKYFSKKFQERKKKKCCKKISPNKIYHSNDEHKCDARDHKCGFACIQCGYYCIENEGHSGLHNCHHGNIKNSFFSILDKYALVRKDNHFYKFKEGETAKIFFCDEYCKTQGQGHTHLFESSIEIKNENVKLYRRERMKYIYESKCSYYWEEILKFNGNFTSNEEKTFKLCNWKCKYESHQTIEYCQLPLWHKEIFYIPKGIYANWVGQGHAFKCIHPIGVYSIFLLDESGSMESKSSFPNDDIIKFKMDNMIGASIQAILDYCKIRNSLNPKDISALIGFNDKAHLIYQNVYVNQIREITNKCISNVKPNGCTFFVNAFKEASRILENIDRKQYVPFIIILSDGLDHGFKETEDYLNNELMKNEKKRENGCKIFSIYFKNNEEQYEFGEIKGKSEEMLQKIAQLGGTERCYNSNNLKELCNVFNKISDAIETNYKLKLKNNSYSINNFNKYLNY